jgi:hypothetical protein
VNNIFGCLSHSSNTKVQVIDFDATSSCKRGPKCLSARPLSGTFVHMTSRSAQNRRESLRSQAQVRWYARYVCEGQSDVCTRPGLEAAHPPYRHLLLLITPDRWGADQWSCR